MAHPDQKKTALKVFKLSANDFVLFVYISETSGQVHLPSKQCLINTTAINMLSVIWKSELTDKIKRSFLQTAVMSILLYRCTTWMLTKCMKKKLDGNYTRMLWAILNKSWRQYPTKQLLYGHLPPITKTIQVRQTRLLEKWGQTHKWHTPVNPFTWTSKGKITSKNLYYNSSVLIQDVALKTGCERRSGRSMLAAQHDDDDDDYGYYIFYQKS